MAMSNVELYEALKGSIPEKAARLIAEVFPAAKDLATKSDVARLEALIHVEITRTVRWMLGLFIPVWATTAGILIVALLRLR